jgi:hypothetical protein
MGAALSIPRTSEFWARRPNRASTGRAVNYRAGGTFLWKAAWCFFVPGFQEAEAWVGERALQILRGKVSDVAAGMRCSATYTRPLPRGAQGIDTCADYSSKP